MGAVKWGACDAIGVGGGGSHIDDGAGVGGNHIDDGGGGGGNHIDDGAGDCYQSGGGCGGGRGCCFGGDGSTVVVVELSKMFRWAAGLR